MRFFLPRLTGDGLQRLLGLCTQHTGPDKNGAAAFAETLAEFGGNTLHVESDAPERFQFVAGFSHPPGEPVVAHLPEVPLVPEIRGRLDALPAVLRPVKRDVHDAEVGVQLRVQRPAGVMGDDGRHHGAGDPVLVCSRPPDPGRRDGLDLAQGLTDRLLPPLSDAAVAADQTKERHVLRWGDLTEVAHAPRRALVAHQEPLAGQGMEPTAEMLELVEFAYAGQTQPLGPGPDPGHLRLTFLRQVIAHSHVLAEILHRATHQHTGFVESHHNAYYA